MSEKQNNYSSKFSKANLTRKIESKESNFNFFKCIINCLNSLMKKWNECNGKLSIIHQMLMFSIPFSIILHKRIYIKLYRV